MAQKTFDDYDVETAQTLFLAGAIHIVDIRESAEWFQTGVIRNASLLAMSAPDFVHALLEAGSAHQHNTNGAHLALLCASGGRSAHAAERLFDSFHTQGIVLSNVLGGITAWQKKGFPIIPYLPS